ncbi:hypothetical protein UAJ10_04560 [Nitrospirillum sp. BR 11164]|uniref:hypothetical protein n=1 Tax=Nitrospirillum sp. BR 11164 TaxID=3104324 RepID=UPI002AFEBA98|nr:hypothetical protein [Nitrospirillum sp. BR 11164]MEA1648287.1 hypothetical protein [Nitrospirillum sp. BR 11164]
MVDKTKITKLADDTVFSIGWQRVLFASNILIYSFLTYFMVFSDFSKYAKPAMGTWAAWQSLIQVSISTFIAYIAFSFFEDSEIIKIRSAHEEIMEKKSDLEKSGNKISIHRLNFFYEMESAISDYRTQRLLDILSPSYMLIISIIIMIKSSIDYDRNISINHVIIIVAFLLISVSSPISTRYSKYTYRKRMSDIVKKYDSETN